MATLSTHTSRTGGTTLTSAIYNEDHERHISNAEALNSELATKLTSADLEGLSSVPIGGIIMWSGSITSIPAGWVLCNGTNGTPDLRNRMVIGAGSTYAVAATGGATTVVLAEANLPAHTHSFSATSSSNGAHTHSGSAASAGSHTHSGNALSAWGNWGSGSITEGTASTGYQVQAIPSGGAHTHTLSINSDGAHTHTISGTSGSTGSGSAHENMPPYYALAFIMRTS